jgi:hypothetical protein
MNSQRLGAAFSFSPSFDEDRLSGSQRFIAEYSTLYRISATELQNADRDRIWPRNYTSRIRAPEPFEITRRQR